MTARATAIAIFPVTHDGRDDVLAWQKRFDAAAVRQQTFTPAPHPRYPHEMTCLNVVQRQPPMRDYEETKRA